MTQGVMACGGPYRAESSPSGHRCFANGAVELPNEDDSSVEKGLWTGMRLRIQLGAQEKQVKGI